MNNTPTELPSQQTIPRGMLGATIGCILSAYALGYGIFGLALPLQAGIELLLDRTGRTTQEVTARLKKIDYAPLLGTHGYIATGEFEQPNGNVIHVIDGQEVLEGKYLPNQVIAHPLPLIPLMIPPIPLPIFVPSPDGWTEQLKIGSTYLVSTKGSPSLGYTILKATPWIEGTPEGITSTKNQPLPSRW